MRWDRRDINILLRGDLGLGTGAVVSWILRSWSVCAGFWVWFWGRFWIWPVTKGRVKMKKLESGLSLLDLGPYHGRWGCGLLDG